MANQTVHDMPHPPTYTLTPVPPLLPWLSDFHLSLLLPIAAYWLMSLIFFLISAFDLFAQHRLHTPEEFKRRNRVSAAQVLRSVLLQQAIQTGLGLLIGYLTAPGDFRGREEYDVVLWAGWVRRAGSTVPWVLTALGVDAGTLGQKLQAYHHHAAVTVPALKASLFFFGRDAASGYHYTVWEMWAARTMYWVGEPAARFGLAVFFSDSWQYFWHRLMHSNQWMYRNMHASHHQIYVPYAFGAFYNTLGEAFLLDTIGTTLSLMLSGLTIRQSMCFGTVSVMKGVDDHCGYRLPWDPLQWFNEQNTAFHDVHHQSWGIKSNYSQLYTTFWDHVCGTVCQKSGEEVEMLYQKGRLAAKTEEKVQ